MNFTRIEDAIDRCKTHLDSTNTRGTEVETYLVGYLIILVIAEYETLFEKIMAKRTSRVGDVHVENFMRVAVDRLTRSIKMNEVAGLLGHFGIDCKTAFNDAMSKTPRATTYYDNIMSNRHLVAHHTGTNMTFVELEIAFIESRIVFQAVADALGLTAAELKGL